MNERIFTMANTKSKAAKKAVVNKPDTVSEIKVDTTVCTAEALEPQPVQKQTVRVRTELDPNSIVTVKNGYQGTLVYKSKKTGEKFIWDTFGDEQDMELSELKSAKNSYKAFFINNWFLIDDPDVIEYLGVSQYYNNALSYDEFESLFTLTPEEIERKLSRLSSGQKHSIAYRARKLIADGEIDSNKVISTLEKCLSIELGER